MPTILREIMKINERQREDFANKITTFFQDNLEGKKIALWGLAFKPNTDDMREAPSVDIIQTLAGLGASCHAYDPKAIETARNIFAGNRRIRFGKNQYEILKNADCLVLVTEWLSFREPDFERMKKLMKRPVIFDGRNQFNPKMMAKRGFTYFCVGRKPVLQGVPAEGKRRVLP